eukprot:1112538_1
MITQQELKSTDQKIIAKNLNTFAPEFCRFCKYTTSFLSVIEIRNESIYEAPKYNLMIDEVNITIVICPKIGNKGVTNIVDNLMQTRVAPPTTFSCFAKAVSNSSSLKTYDNPMHLRIDEHNNESLHFDNSFNPIASKKHHTANTQIHIQIYANNDGT